MNGFNRFDCLMEYAREAVNYPSQMSDLAREAATRFGLPVIVNEHNEVLRVLSWESSRRGAVFVEMKLYEKFFGSAIKFLTSGE